MQQAKHKMHKLKPEPVYGRQNTTLKQELCVSPIFSGRRNPEFSVLGYKLHGLNPFFLDSTAYYDIYCAKMEATQVKRSFSVYVADENKHNRSREEVIRIYGSFRVTVAAKV